MSNQHTMCGTANSMIPNFFPTYLDTTANTSVPINPPMAKHAPTQDTSSVVIGPIGESSDCRRGTNGDAHPITAPCENASRLTEMKSKIQSHGCDTL
jgi:hypothetical protein